MKSKVCLVFVFWAITTLAAWAQQEPVAFVNELYNSNTQGDEWTEIVVIKDDLDLRGYYLGDNNAGTDAWQPKLQFKNIPLWQHLRAGTYIIVSHAKTQADCDAFAEDTDAADGRLKVCSFVVNSPYFEGGASSQTLNLASGGDFVHLVSPTGQWIQGIGYDANPGSSVKGGTCYQGGQNWADITASVTANRPCGKYLFLEENLLNPQGIGYLGSTVAELVPASGIIYTATGTAGNLLDVVAVPSLAEGNSLLNVQLLRKLRQPLWPNVNTSCTQPARGGNLLPIQLPAYPNFADNTLQYLVVRYDTPPLPAEPPPLDGLNYTIGQQLGSGKIVGRLAQTSATIQDVSFTDSFAGFSATSHYRVYMYRYTSTQANLRLSQGSAYNEAQYWIATPGASVTIVGPASLCLQDTGTYTVTAFGQVQLQYSASEPGVTLAPTTNGVQVSFTAQFPATAQQVVLRVAPASGATDCARPDTIIITLNRPVPVTLQGPNTICFGDTATLTVAGIPANALVYYSVNQGGVQLIPNGASVKVVTGAIASDSPFIIFATPAGAGCVGQGSINMLAKPKQVVGVTGDTLKNYFQEITLKVSGGRWPYSVTPAGLLQADSVTYLSRDTATKTYTFTGSPAGSGSTSCRAKGTFTVKVAPLVPLFIPTVVVPEGKAVNQTFAIKGATVKRLQIFSRWGKQVLDASNYAGDWVGKAGIYYYTADLVLSSGVASTYKGWVEVVE